MSVERVGDFIEFKGEDGCLTLCRVSSIQIVAESDSTGGELLLTAANRTMRVDARLSELKAVLAERCLGRRWS